jgi:hypothetical protein
MAKFSEFFQDGEGQFSATRLGFLLWVIGVLVVWAVESISTRTLQSIPDSVTTIIGVLMAGKVVQNFGERGAANAGSTPSATSASPPPV